MNPYEVLGVAPNASADQIKAEWKVLSWAFHPDRNPAADAGQRMAEINQAYEILSTPVRKAHYDATGKIEQPKSMEMRIFNEALAAIAATLSEPSNDIVAQAKFLVQKKLNELTVGSQNLRGMRERLREQRKGIKTNQKTNLFHMVIDQQLGQIEEKLQQNYDADDVVTGAFKLLQDYEKEPDAPQFAPFIASWSAGTSSTTGL